MTKEVAALALTVLVHFIGLGALVYALLRDDEQRHDWRGWWPGDDDAPTPPRPPLPDAQPARVRLRDEGRLGDAHPPPPRRPAHAPRRAPERTPAGD